MSPLKFGKTRSGDGNQVTEGSGLDVTDVKPRTQELAEAVTARLAQAKWMCPFQGRLGGPWAATP